MTPFFAVALILASAAPAAHAAAFPDLPVDPSLRAPIEELAAAGILHGHDDGRFRPMSPVTHGEWAKLVLNTRSNARAAENAAPMHRTTSAAASQAVQEGLWGASTPWDDEVLRIEAIAFLAAAYGLTPPDGYIGETTFQDVPAEHARLFAYLEQLGIIQGIAPGVLGTTPLLRQEAAKLVALARRLAAAPRVAPSRVQLQSITRTTLSPGDSTTVLFSFTDGVGGGIAGLTEDDFRLMVLQGALTVTSFFELGSGVYGYTLRANPLGPPGPIQLRIVALRAAGYQALEIPSAVQEPAALGLRVTPSRVLHGERATIIAIPSNPFTGQPVSGLRLSASVVAGSGQISRQMEESPAGSGIYTGEYTATGFDGATIRVFIDSLATLPSADVTVSQI